MKKRVEKSKTLVLVIVCIAFVSIVTVIGTQKVISYQENQHKIELYIEKVNSRIERLTKQELVGNENDALMNEISGILSELQTGKGRYGLVSIEDEKYQQKLQEYVKSWEDFQKNIELFRKTSDKSKLYEESEDICKLTEGLEHYVTSM